MDAIIEKLFPPRNGPVVLYVNGEKVDILFGNEEQVDISAFLKNGSNKIILVVTGSLKNTLGPHYFTPAPGMVSPWHWRFITEPLPGKDYSLYNYGLTEEFSVIRIFNP